MKRPEVHGHRGSRGTHPENTLPAFQEAVDCGAEFLELDLQFSRDEIPMVFHDPEISPRLCLVDKLIPVRTLTGAELAKYDVGSVKQAKFPQQKLIPGTLLPSFEDVLKWAAGNRIHFNIELKQETVAPAPLPDPRRYAAAVVGLLRKYRMLERARIQSFVFDPLVEARKLEPELVMACLFEEQRDFIAETLATGAQVVAPDYKLLTPELIAQAHGKGLRVIPWTVNDPVWWQRLTQWGIDGIITDYPRRCLAQRK